MLQVVETDVSDLRGCGAQDLTSPIVLLQERLEQVLSWKACGHAWNYEPGESRSIMGCDVPEIQRFIWLIWNCL